MSNIVLDKIPDIFVIFLAKNFVLVSGNKPIEWMSNKCESKKILNTVFENDSNSHTLSKLIFVSSKFKKNGVKSGREKK